MFFKLALGNVRKSARDYSIYFVTLALSVAVFYAFNSISAQASSLQGASLIFLTTGMDLIRGLTAFLAVVMGFLMVYANNCLLRRRKNELGLYQLMGMRLSHVACILTLETLLVTIGSFVIGILAGVLLSYGMVFLTAAMFQAKVVSFAPQLSLSAALFTLRCFLAIFAVMLVRNLVTLRYVRLSDLMSAEQQNETIVVRSLGSTIVMGVIGLALIVYSYQRFLIDGLSFVDAEGGAVFLVTTILMIAGTFALFYALSGIILHGGRLIKKFYFHGLNMFTLRQIAARVNSLSTSMAVVSLILFLSITSVGTCMGLSAAINDRYEGSTPYDASICVSYAYSGGLDKIEQSASNMEIFASASVSNSHEALPVPSTSELVDALEDKGVDINGIASGYAVRTEYDYKSVEGGANAYYVNIAKDSGIALPSDLEPSASSPVTVSYDESDPFGTVDPMGNLVYVSATDYNASRKLMGEAPIDLDGKYLFASNYKRNPAEQEFYSEVMASGYKLNVGGEELSPAAEGFDDSSCAIAHNTNKEKARLVVVVPDEVLEGARPIQTVLNLNYSVSKEEGDEYAMAHFPQSSDRNSWAFLEGDPNGACAVAWMSITSTEAMGTDAGTAGLVAYLSLYIGFVLVVTCAAILAIQQLSAATDATPSYLLLSELGASEKMIRRSLFRQTLFFFGLPLVIGSAHALVALTKTLELTTKITGPGSILVTAVAVIAFALVYVLYFVVTYLMTRGIVSAKARR